MWSVCRRRRLASTSRSIQMREYWPSLGRFDIALPSLVASTQSCRWGWISAPTIDSDAPWVYTSAVSMKFTPAAWAWATMAAASAWSVWSPNIIVPRHRADTCRLLVPRRR